MLTEFTTWALVDDIEVLVKRCGESWTILNNARLDHVILAAAAIMEVEYATI